MPDLPRAVVLLREMSMHLEATSAALLNLSEQIKDLLCSDPTWKEDPDGPGADRPTE